MWNDETLLNHGPKKSCACFRIKIRIFPCRLSLFFSFSHGSELWFHTKGDLDWSRWTWRIAGIKRFRKIDLLQLFWYVIARLPSLIPIVVSNGLLVSSIRFIFIRESAPSHYFLLGDLASWNPSFRRPRCDISQWPQVRTRFISRGQYVALRRDGLSASSSSFLFSQNGAALRARREI